MLEWLLLADVGQSNPTGETLRFSIKHGLLGYEFDSQLLSCATESCLVVKCHVAMGRETRETVSLERPIHLGKQT